MTREQTTMKGTKHVGETVYRLELSENEARILRRVALRDMIIPEAVSRVHTSVSYDEVQRVIRDLGLALETAMDHLS